MNSFFFPMNICKMVDRFREKYHISSLVDFFSLAFQYFCPKGQKTEIRLFFLFFLGIISVFCPFGQKYWNIRKKKSTSEEISYCSRNMSKKIYVFIGKKNEFMVLTDLTGIKINNLRYKKLNWPLISIGDLFFFWGRGENHPTITRAKNHQSGSNILIFLIYFYFFRNLKKWEKLVFAPYFDRGTFFFWNGGEGHPMSTHAKNHQSESII